VDVEELKLLKLEVLKLKDLERREERRTGTGKT
jgi:hypothetical protein